MVLFLIDLVGILFYVVWNRWYEYVGKKKKKKKKNKEEVFLCLFLFVCIWWVVCVGFVKDYVKIGVFLGFKVKFR